MVTSLPGKENTNFR